MKMLQCGIVTVIIEIAHYEYLCLWLCMLQGIKALAQARHSTLAEKACRTLAFTAAREMHYKYIKFSQKRLALYIKYISGRAHTFYRVDTQRIMI